MAINKVGSKGIQDGSVATVDLAPGTVTNAKLTNSSFTLEGTSIALGGSNNITISAEWQSVITADGSTGTTAVAKNGYFIDTTSAAHTLTLPASATIGDFIAIKDYAGTFNTNNLTIARNGHNIQGAANDSLISTNRASLVLVYVDSTKGWLYWEEHNVADLQAPAFTSATGGTITTSGDFKIHTFTGDGCFVVSTLGNSPTVPTGGPSNVDYLVVAGGGAGGNAPSTSGAGGGGAGGYRTTFPSPGCNAGSFPISATTYPITVGGGGSAGGGSPSNQGGQGSDSIFSSITSTGGGGGGNYGGANGAPGGSGGGAGLQVPTLPSPGLGNTPPVSPPQGNNGGVGTPSVSYQSAGGGGGANANGSNATGSGSSPGDATPSSGGAGGNGNSNSITNSPVSYSGGGGGGGAYAQYNSGIQPGGIPGGSGGSGGGGAGGSTTSPTTPGTGSPGTAGTSNTGGGGGGSAGLGPATGGAGGKGIVIIRYKFQ